MHFEQLASARHDYLNKASFDIAIPASGSCLSVAKLFHIADPHFDPLLIL
jgi:hypothetical protein